MPLASDDIPLSRVGINTYCRERDGLLDASQGACYGLTVDGCAVRPAVVGFDVEPPLAGVGIAEVGIIDSVFGGVEAIIVSQALVIGNRAMPGRAHKLLAASGSRITGIHI